jgi:branched-chain amino acid aminotransferase
MAFTRIFPLIAIPITSLSINRGYGAYEFFEVIRRKPFYGQRHMARFARSLEILMLKNRLSQSVA